MERFVSGMGLKEVLEEIVVAHFAACHVYNAKCLITLDLMSKSDSDEPNDTQKISNLSRFIEIRWNMI